MCTGEGQESVDAAPLAGFDRLGTAVDVVDAGAGSPHTTALRVRWRFPARRQNRLPSDGEARLDDVDAHLVEHLGESSFSSWVMVAPGTARRRARCIEMMTRSASDFGGH